MDRRFSDKVILLAGGTGGLGQAVSLAFLAELGKVVVTYRQQGEFAALQKAAANRASQLEGHQVDVTDETAVRQCIDQISERYGRLDVLVNAVGGYAGGTALWQTDTNVFDKMLALNLRSGYLLSRAAVALMIKQGSGVVVNIASRSALDHSAGAAAYAASKAAAVAMIDSLAADLKGTGVRANSVLPGIIDTAVNRKAMSAADFSKWPKPEEIARVILFLCSDDAKLISGASVPVYGDA